MPSDNILVTGFGPFGEHKINASWEAVKLLPQYKFNNANLIIKEVPVLYKYIDEQIPDLWKVYDPKLVVHVGVSSYTNKLNIETQAFRMGYIKEDCGKNLHPTGENCSAANGADCIKASLDANKICAVINTSDKLKACVSTDAGRYLCEFTYYKSLNIDRSRTMFIHVPPLGQPYTAEELAEGLSQIIQCALDQIDDSCACSTSESILDLQ